MKSIPVNTAEINFTCIEVVAKTRRDDRTGREFQSENQDGLPVWTVRCLTQIEGQKPETLDVSVASAKEPALGALIPVEFGNLVARPWSMDGRSGLSFSAENVRAKSSSNGKSAPAPAAAPAS